MRDEDQRIELRTANTLRNVEREQWKTTYDYQFTGMYTNATKCKHAFQSDFFFLW